MCIKEGNSPSTQTILFLHLSPTEHLLAITQCCKCVCYNIVYMIIIVCVCQYESVSETVRLLNACMFGCCYVRVRLLEEVVLAKFGNHQNKVLADIKDSLLLI